MESELRQFVLKLSSTPSHYIASEKKCLSPVLAICVRSRAGDSSEKEYLPCVCEILSLHLNLHYERLGRGGGADREAGRQTDKNKEERGGQRKEI